MTELTFRRITRKDLDDIRQTLLAVYVEVYGDRIDEPFFTLAEFDRRLSGYATSPQWECVLGMEDGEPVGYAFGYTLSPNARWWNGLLTPVNPEDVVETGERTFALNELMVRAPWRGTGAARQIHDQLVTGRTEQRVTLLVEASHSKVRRTYESWGYVRLAQLRPDIPDAPTLDAMLLQRPATADDLEEVPSRRDIRRGTPQ